VLVDYNHIVSLVADRHDPTTAAAICAAVCSRTRSQSVACASSAPHLVRLADHAEGRRAGEMPEQTEPSVRLTCVCGCRVFCRAGADVPISCSFCQSTLQSAAPSSGGPANKELLATSGEGVPLPPPPVRRRLFVAEIVCLMCGREAGTAAAEHWPPTGPIFFQPPDTATISLVRAWWRIRCTACGGNTAAREVTIRTVRIEPAIDWRTDRPRRGRPPKWLVEQRRSDGPDAA
jgi:hypothetical protein